MRTAVGRRATRESINRYRAPLFDSEHRPVGRYDKLTTACTNDSLRELELMRWRGSPHGFIDPVFLPQSKSSCRDLASSKAPGLTAPDVGCRRIVVALLQALSPRFSRLSPRSSQSRH